MFCYVRSNSVVSRMIAGELLIIPVRGGVGDLASIYGLNPVGSAIWQAIAQPRTTDEIVDAIDQEFEGDRAKIQQDVELFLAEMNSAGLVKTVGATA